MPTNDHIRVANILLEEGYVDEAVLVLGDEKEAFLKLSSVGQLTLRIDHTDNRLVRDLERILRRATSPRGRPLGRASYKVTNVFSNGSDKLHILLETDIKDKDVALDAITEDLIGLDGLSGLLKRITSQHKETSRLLEMLYGGYPGSSIQPPKPLRVIKARIN